MEKRVLIAFALSLLVLTTWSALVPKPKNPYNPQVYPQKTLVPAPSVVQSPQPVSPETVSPVLQFEYQNAGNKFIFIEPQAAIKEVQFSSYQNYTFALKNSLLFGFQNKDNNWDFVRQLSENKEVTYIYSDQEKKITKRFKFFDASYAINLEITIQNLTTAPLKFDPSQFPLKLGTVDLGSTQSRFNIHELIVSDAEKISYPNIKSAKSFKEIKFIGLKDKYFCVIVEPLEPGYCSYSSKVSKINNEFEVGLFTPKIKLEPGATWKNEFKIYIGPLDATLLKAGNPDWQALIYFGRFDLIAQVLLKMLEFIHNFVRNWGLAIIILSLLIYIILYPLTLKQMKSMKEMQALQPQIEELRKNYKDNPQRLNKEIMELYRLHKVNPFGGCLPLVLQIPIFFALYQVLMRSVALKGAGFLWIKDLSEPDRLYVFGTALPLLGNEFNILPILMAIGMFIQQKSSTANMGGQQAEQQKMMLVAMPIIFGVLFYRMPSGLVLYWLINSTLTLIYQIRVARHK